MRWRLAAQAEELGGLVGFAFQPALDEEFFSIGKEERCAAGVDEDNVLALGETPLAQLIDEAGKTLARIGGVD